MESLIDVTIRHAFMKSEQQEDFLCTTSSWISVLCLYTFSVRVEIPRVFRYWRAFKCVWTSSSWRRSTARSTHATGINLGRCRSWNKQGTFAALFLHPPGNWALGRGWNPKSGARTRRIQGRRPRLRPSGSVANLQIAALSRQTESLMIGAGN